MFSGGYWNEQTTSAFSFCHCLMMLDTSLMSGGTGVLLKMSMPAVARKTCAWA